MHLFKDDLKTILQFMEAFGQETVEVTCDNSSGIGSVIQAKIHGVYLNGQQVSVTKTIVDEKDW
jgi:hypothetical protein